MKTDRELLELTAKAAGYNQFDGHAIQMIDSGWNPLMDDGDALRLAVKLQIDLEWQEDGEVEAYQRNDTTHYCAEEKDDDMASATRRAIVRAAAAIGESMLRNMQGAAQAGDSAQIEGGSHV